MKLENKGFYFNERSILITWNEVKSLPDLKKVAMPILINFNITKFIQISQLIVCFLPLFHDMPLTNTSSEINSAVILIIEHEKKAKCAA